jgi:ubiquinol-cytochrome c reductase cytochrome b subunit
MALVIQVLTGVLLRVHYSAFNSYERVLYIMREVNYGWLFKLFHSGNASLIFILLYLHLYKGVKISRYRLSGV